MKLKKLAAVLATGIIAAGLCVALTGCGDDGAKASGEYTLLNEGTLTVATSPDYPPFENLVDGEYVGFELDLARQIAEDLGLQVEFVTIQFDGLITAVATGGQCDISASGFTITPDRLEQVDFTDSYYVDDIAVAVLKDSAYTEENAAADLNKEGVKIAVQSGTTGESYIQENFPNATVVPFGNSNDCFAALDSNQVDAACTNMAVVSSMLKAYSDASIVITVATGEEYGIAVSKDNPNLTAAINELIAKYQEDGTLEDLTLKYFG